MLVRRQPVFLMTAQKRIDAAGRVPDLLEFLGERLVVLDVFLGLRLRDRQVSRSLRSGSAASAGQSGAGSPDRAMISALARRADSRLFCATSLTIASF